MFAFHSRARVLAAGLPRQENVYSTTDESFRFHNKKINEMRCKLRLDFTENPRSFEKYPPGDTQFFSEVPTSRWGWVFLERTRILNGIQFTTHFKRWALGNYFSKRISFMFLISKCGGNSDLGLCTASGLAFREPMRILDFCRRQKSISAAIFVGFFTLTKRAGFVC